MENRKLRQDLPAALGVDHFGVELDAVEAALAVADGGDGQVSVDASDSSKAFGECVATASRWLIQICWRPAMPRRGGSASVSSQSEPVLAVVAR
jgi:hypothetical protein